MIRQLEVHLWRHTADPATPGVEVFIVMNSWIKSLNCEEISNGVTYKLINHLIEIFCSFLVLSDDFK